jgi:hypothetical protein
MAKTTRARKPVDSTKVPRRRTALPRRRAEDLKRILNVLPSKKTDQDWGFENAAEAGILGAVAAVPATKDLRATWWKINNQGATGSWVGWATVDSVLRWMLVRRDA